MFYSQKNTQKVKIALVKFSKDLLYVRLSDEKYVCEIFIVVLPLFFFRLTYCKKMISLDELPLQIKQEEIFLEDLILPSSIPTKDREINGRHKPCRR